MNRARDNRWYRLLQFLEVPSRVHRMLGNYVALARVPGKVNLNTIRHWEVYAGLVDNPTVLDRMPKPDPPNGVNPLGRITVDRTRDENNTFNSRDRWIEYLRERDGDYVNGYDPRPDSHVECLSPACPGPTHSTRPATVARPTNAPAVMTPSKPPCSERSPPIAWTQQATQRKPTATGWKWGRPTSTPIPMAQHSCTSTRSLPK
ncbi:MAG UNVERIFIED_CONTAM: hypothetical protein LVR18_21030 [Planctomycetaceae bacterium]